MIAKGNGNPLQCSWGIPGTGEPGGLPSQVAQSRTRLKKFSSSSIYWVFLMVKNLPAMHKTQVRSLSQEDPLEKGMATHSSILTWRIPRTEERERLQSWGHRELDPTMRPTFTFLLFQMNTFWKLMSEPDLLADGESCPPLFSFLDKDIWLIDRMII